MLMHPLKRWSNDQENTWTNDGNVYLARRKKFTAISHAPNGKHSGQGLGYSCYGMMIPPLDQEEEESGEYKQKAKCNLPFLNRTTHDGFSMPPSCIRPGFPNT